MVRFNIGDMVKFSKDGLERLYPLPSRKAGRERAETQRSVVVGFSRESYPRVNVIGGSPKYCITFFPGFLEGVK